MFLLLLIDLVGLTLGIMLLKYFSPYILQADGMFFLLFLCAFLAWAFLRELNASIKYGRKGR